MAANPSAGDALKTNAEGGALMGMRPRCRRGPRPDHVRVARSGAQRAWFLSAALATVFAATHAFAQDVASFPTRPIRLVIPFAPGGTADTVGRIVSDKLAGGLGKPVVLDNRPGANTVIGCEIVAQATPDGHTILVVAAGFAVNPSLRKKLPYDSLRDLAPVGLVGSGPYLLVVHPSIPAKTAGEFIAWVKARPGQVSYASTGVGSPPHLAAELLRTMAGLDIVHVPYKGGGAALPDVLSGRVPMFFGSVATFATHIRAGKVRGIAMTTPKRSPVLPEIPTFDESGLKGYDVTGWYGILAPGKTPRPIVNRLNAELRQVLADAETQKRLAQAGIEPAPGSPADFAALIKAEIPKWAKVLKRAGIEPE
jgi:tripartite-type tricarboxylate transporter receptor subunit TctC